MRQRLRSAHTGTARPWQSWPRRATSPSGSCAARAPVARGAPAVPHIWQPARRSAAAARAGRLVADSALRRTFVTAPLPRLPRRTEATQAVAAPGGRVGERRACSCRASEESPARKVLRAGRNGTGRGGAAPRIAVPIRQRQGIPGPQPPQNFKSSPGGVSYRGWKKPPTRASRRALPLGSRESRQHSEMMQNQF